MAFTTSSQFVSMSALTDSGACSEFHVHDGGTDFMFLQRKAFLFASTVSNVLTCVAMICCRVFEVDLWNIAPCDHFKMKTFTCSTALLFLFAAIAPTLAMHAVKSRKLHDMHTGVGQDVQTSQLWRCCCQTTWLEIFGPLAWCFPLQLVLRLSLCRNPTVHGDDQVPIWLKMMKNVGTFTSMTSILSPILVMTFTWLVGYFSIERLARRIKSKEFRCFDEIALHAMKLSDDLRQLWSVKESGTVWLVMLGLSLTTTATSAFVSIMSLVSRYIEAANFFVSLFSTSLIFSALMAQALATLTSAGKSIESSSRLLMFATREDHEQDLAEKLYTVEGFARLTSCIDRAPLGGFFLDVIITQSFVTTQFLKVGVIAPSIYSVLNRFVFEAEGKHTNSTVEVVISDITYRCQPV